MSQHDLQFEIAFCQSMLERDPGNLTVMEMLAGYYTRAGQIESGLELDRRIVRLDPGNPVSHYNLACSLALAGSPEEALDSLRTAMEQGYLDFEWMREDPDLDTLRQHPEFDTLLAEFQTRK